MDRVEVYCTALYHNITHYSMMYSNTTIDGPCRGDPHGTDVDMAVIKVKEG